MYKTFDMLLEMFPQWLECKTDEDRWKCYKELNPEFFDDFVV